LFVVLLIVAPSSQELEPPTIPARFSSAEAITWKSIRPPWTRSNGSTTGKSNFDTDGYSMSAKKLAQGQRMKPPKS
jgi:hypothetical protein